MAMIERRQFQAVNGHTGAWYQLLAALLFAPAPQLMRPDLWLVQAIQLNIGAVLWSTILGLCSMMLLAGILLDRRKLRMAACVSLGFFWLCSLVIYAAYYGYTPINCFFAIFGFMGFYSLKHEVRMKVKRPCADKADRTWFFG